MVPFCPFCCGAPLSKPTSRKKSTLTIKELLRNLEALYTLIDPFKGTLIDPLKEHPRDHFLFAQDPFVDW